MTQPDHEDRAPGMGDPNRSDDVAIPGVRTGGPGSAGSAPEGGLDGPAPAEGATGAARPDVDPGPSDHPAGQLGAAGGGYGTASGEGTPGGGPDGEDVQVTSGPGPQTDWLRGAAGGGDDRHDPGDPRPGTGA